MIVRDNVTGELCEVLFFHRFLNDETEISFWVMIKFDNGSSQPRSEFDITYSI